MGDIADWGHQAFVIEPAGPFKGCKLDGFEGLLRTAPMDHFGLIEAVYGLGQGIITITDAADGGLDLGLRQAFGVLDRDILGSAIGVVDEAAAMLWAPLA